MPRVHAMDLQICTRARARVNVATPSRAATSQLGTIEGTPVRVVDTAATLMPDVAILCPHNPTSISNGDPLFGAYDTAAVRRRSTGTRLRNPMFSQSSRFGTCRIKAQCHARVLR